MTSKSKPRLMNAVEEAEILSTLEGMEKDGRYNTASRYHNNTEKYPTNQISFSETHMAMLKKFPLIDPRQYVANLKLITKR